MSDALSDISRDERRNFEFGKFLGSLVEYLSSPSEESKNQVYSSASSTDSISRGYFGSKTNLSKDLDKTLESLQKEDQIEWLKLLSSSKGFSQYNEFLKISPFKDYSMFPVNYGYGFRMDNSSEPNFFDEIVKSKGHQTFNGGEFYVKIPQDLIQRIIDESEVISLEKK